MEGDVWCNTAGPQTQLPSSFFSLTGGIFGKVCVLDWEQQFIYLCAVGGRFHYSTVARIKVAIKKTCLGCNDKGLIMGNVTTL